MVHSGKPGVRVAEKVSESQSETVRQVSDKIDVVERNCDREGFDSEVVDDVGGILTLGVCSQSGVDLDASRLGIHLLDDDRRFIERDMADRIKSKSTYLVRAAEDVLGPLMKDSKKNSALAYWATVARRLDSDRVNDVEKRWLLDEEGRQDVFLMRDVSGSFKSALSKSARKDALNVFSRIRRAGNNVPVLSRLLKSK